MNIIVVDEQDKEIGVKPIEELTNDDIYRVSALWLINDKDQILLARRGYNKKHSPGCWGPAVAGTLEEGETYDSNIIKEAAEEIGLKDIKPEKGPKIHNKIDYNHFTQWYILKVSKETNFKVQKSEVAEIKWWNKEELLKEIKNNPESFVPSMARDNFPMI
jgi:isopentenyldiphosphate isomerase